MGKSVCNKCGKDFQQYFREGKCNTCKADEGRMWTKKERRDRRDKRIHNILRGEVGAHASLSYIRCSDPDRYKYDGTINLATKWEFRYSIGRAKPRAQLIFKVRKGNELYVVGRCMRVHRESRRTTVGMGAKPDVADHKRIKDYGYSTADGRCDCRICGAVHFLNRYFKSIEDITPDDLVELSPQ